ncbi:MAG: UDP-N-acetylglucosamine 1-carboxyvinyltransferase, partial [Clostridiales bacterium]|nr:UDP-N-acetylglucosamine 1-carboxyvinyltransferase [Clostridiales bacterium]
DFINSMGGEISGAGSDVITVIGKKHYHGTEFTVIPDRIVAGTYIAAAAATGSDIYIKNVPVRDMLAVFYKFMDMGVEITSQSDGIRVVSPKRLSAVSHTHTMPYPGFPTDMQAQLTATLSVARGYSVVRENIFDNRFRFVDSLTDMGADIFVENNKTAYICGVNKLHGANVQGTDLRGTAALIVAALAAEGTTVIEKAGYINRGYEDIASALQSVGAQVVWI